MYTLNSSKPTFLQTNSEYDNARNRIARRLTAIPNFSRWITEENSVKESWDWGTPAELYVRGIVQERTLTFMENFGKTI